MKCPTCGYDAGAPVGKALEDSDKHNNVKVLLTPNGKLWIHHQEKCRGIKINKIQFPKGAMN